VELPIPYEWWERNRCTGIDPNANNVVPLSKCIPNGGECILWDLYVIVNKDEVRCSTSADHLVSAE